MINLWQLVAYKKCWCDAYKFKYTVSMSSFNSGWRILTVWTGFYYAFDYSSGESFSEHSSALDRLPRDVALGIILFLNHMEVSRIRTWVQLSQNDLIYHLKYHCKLPRLFKSKVTRPYSPLNRIHFTIISFNPCIQPRMSDRCDDISDDISDELICMYMDLSLGIM